MKSRLVLNMLMLVVVCVLGWLALNHSSAPKLADAGTLKISGLIPAQVDRILVQTQGHATIRLEKRADGWRVAPAGRADRYQVERLLNIASATSKSKIESGDLRQFGLDPPLATVTLNDQAFRFGSTNGITFEQYLATADGIFLVSTQFGSSLPNEVSGVLARSLLNDGELPVGFDLPDFKLSKDKDSGKWTGSGRRAPGPETSQDEFNKFADGWRFASALSASPWKGGREISRWTVQLQNGGSVKYALAATEPELILVRLDEKIEFHFQHDMLKKLAEIPKSVTEPAPDAGATPAPPAQDK